MAGPINLNPTGGLLPAMTPEPPEQPRMSFGDRVSAFFQDEENVAKFIMALEPLRGPGGSGGAPVQYAQNVLTEGRARKAKERETQQYVEYLRSRGVINESQAAQLIQSPSLAAAMAQGAIQSQFRAPTKPSVFREKVDALVASGMSEKDAVNQVLKSGGTVINLGQQGQAAMLGAAGKEIAGSDMAIFKAAQAAVPQILKMDEALSLIDSGKANTGMFADLKTTFDRIKSAFSGDPEAVERASETQVLNALLGQEVFGAIAALGIGARGLDTPAEREFLRDVLSGRIAMEDDALRKLTKIRRKAQVAILEKYNNMVQKDQFAYLAPLGLGDRFTELEIPTYNAPAPQGAVVVNSTQVRLPNGQVKEFATEAGAQQYADAYNASTSGGS